MNMNVNKVYTLFFSLFFWISVSSFFQTYADEQDLEILSIVLSRNCPDSMVPETLVQSVENPECPHIGENQLIQVTAANYGKKEVRVGIELLILRNDQPIPNSPRWQGQLIPPYDRIRVLHSYKIPEGGGRFHVSARIWDSSFKHILEYSKQGVDRSFTAPSPADIEEAQARDRKKKEEELAALAPKKLEFDQPDLRWEEAKVIPKHVLRGEPFRVRLSLVNVGGDIVRSIENRVEYYNSRLPLRKTLIAEPKVEVMAPGEAITFELEYTLPDDQLLGDYEIFAVTDPKNMIVESKEDNNEIRSNAIRLSDIKLLLPTDEFKFDADGLFLFQWDSLVFSEFKIQIGIDDKFEEPGTLFDLPQGDRWIADKELVPLSGELPQMAQGLMQTFNKEKVYWRVVGRKANGKQSVSDVRTFTIKAGAPPSK